MTGEVISRSFINVMRISFTTLVTTLYLYQPLSYKILNIEQ